MITEVRIVEKIALKTEQGWHASLNLEIVESNGKSLVHKSRQSGPLTIQSPFYPEDGVCHLYLLHPPAGIVGGDVLELSVSAGQRSSALITTPGATKFYRTNGKLAHQEQRVRICDGSSLEFLPQETIYYPDTDASIFTTVHLEGSGQYLGWEIHCLGLPSRGEDLGTGKARIRLSVFRDDIMILNESVIISGEKKKFQAAFMRECPVYGSFVMTNGTENLLERLRGKVLGEHDWCGLTIVEDLLVIRYIGSSVVQVRQLFMRAWQEARPIVLGRKPVPPRIWQT